MPISLAALELEVDGKSELTDFSITTGASGQTALAYDNTTGVFNITPVLGLTDIGIADGSAGQVLTTDGSGNFSFATMGAPLTAYSVTTNTAGTAALSYDNTNGVFTYTPPDLSTLIGLTDIQVLTAAAGTPSLTYDNTTGEFIYTPPVLYGDPDVSSYINGNADFSLIPDTDYTYDIGSNSYRWRNLYAQTATFTSKVDTGLINPFSGPLKLEVSAGNNIQLQADEILPNSDDSQDIGSSTFQWKQVWTRNLDLSDSDTFLVPNNTTAQTADGALTWNATTNKLYVGDGTTAIELGGIGLTSLSAATASAGTAGLTYDNSTGVFTFTPPDLSSYLTAESDTLATITARGATTTTAVTVQDISITGTMTVDGPSRNALETANSGSFDMNSNTHFSCTPTGAIQLTFTNITDGQSGNIYFDNSGGHTITKAAHVKMNATGLTTISTAGIFWLSYFSNGTDVLLSNSLQLA